MGKDTKPVLGYLGLIATIAAISMTEWRGGHPIGSFAESFVAVILIFSCFIVAGYIGIQTKEFLDKNQKFHKPSTVIAWAVALVTFIVCATLIHSIPGIPQALDRLPESSE